jgi:hypothetical protein
MMGCNYTNGVYNDIINIANKLSKEATNYALGLSNVASQAFFDNILDLSISESRSSIV